MKIPYQPSMSKIYSRKRLRPFKPQKYNWHKKRKTNSSFGFFMVIIIVAILFYMIITKSVEPIFDKLCSNEARSIANKIINDESSRALENYTYNDLYSIERDASRKYTNDKCKYFYNR